MIDLILNIEPDTHNVARNITLLLVTVFLVIVFIAFTKSKNDKLFGEWFENILILAPRYGFTQVEIDNFEEIFWWDYFCQDLTPAEALEIHLKN